MIRVQSSTWKILHIQIFFKHNHYSLDNLFLYDTMINNQKRLANMAISNQEVAGIERIVMLDWDLGPLIRLVERPCSKKACMEKESRFTLHSPDRT